MSASVSRGRAIPTPSGLLGSVPRIDAQAASTADPGQTRLAEIPGMLPALSEQRSRLRLRRRAAHSPPSECRRAPPPPCWSRRPATLLPAGIPSVRAEVAYG